ncbi:MAG: T9SS type A sorting domain-containing protein [Tenuifilaceae bacterium]
MSIKIAVLEIFIIFFTTLAPAQQVMYGTNNYIEYQVGTLPFVISVSHGGNIEPTSIPNRTCNNPVYATDAYTIETALEIKNALFRTTGCYPHLIISHLKRSKLDPNRNIADGACGNAEAETAWNEFHNFITVARISANQQYDNKTFFVDLHGHSNPIQRIELGYLLYDDELELADNVLNTNQYINYSSIRNLALANLNSYSHAQLLRGQKSLGTLLTDRSFPSVPSQSIPFPGTTTNYFSGGYITENHTCYSSGVDINGLQMELNYTGVRDNPYNRAKFATAFSEGIIEYMNTHFDMTWNSCNPILSIYEASPTSKIIIYPNPSVQGELVGFDNLGNKTYYYYIFNALGQDIKSGQLSQSENRINTSMLNSGIYFIHLIEIENGEKIVIKLIVK